MEQAYTARATCSSFKGPQVLQRAAATAQDYHVAGPLAVQLAQSRHNLPGGWLPWTSTGARTIFAKASAGPLFVKCPAPPPLWGR